MRIQKPLALTLIILGTLTLILQPFTSITGAVIDISTPLAKTNFIIGLTLLITGIALFSLNLTDLISPTTDVPIITPSKKFKKQTKGIDQRTIRNATKKIGTKLGHEKPRGYGDSNHSIRTDKGGRIFYQPRKDGSIVLTEYVPSSKHH